MSTAGFPQVSLSDTVQEPQASEKPPLDLQEVTEDELFSSGLKQYQSTALDLLQNVDTVLLFDGRTPDDWAREHYVNIPEDCTPAQLVAVAPLLLKNLAIAYRYLLAAEASDSSIQSILNNQKIKEVQQIVAELERDNKRRPAKDHLEALAESRLSNIVGAANYIKSRHSFWRGRVQYLIHIKEVLKTIGFVLSVESKTIE